MTRPDARARDPDTAAEPHPASDPEPDPDVTSGSAADPPGGQGSAQAPDRRLVVPALAAWTAAAVCVALPGGLTLVAASGLLLVAVAALRVGRPLVALVLVVASAAAASAGLRVAHDGAGPVPLLADEGAAVHAEVTLSTDPRLVDGAFGDQVVVEADAVQVDGRGVRVSGAAPVLLLGPADSGLATQQLGSTVAVVGRLAPADSADLAGLLLVSRVDGVPADAAWWWSAAGGVRAAVAAASASRGQPGALVPALVVGDDSALSEQTVEDFRSSGLTHLLAVSGTNLTLVLGALLLLARGAGVRGRGLLLTGVLAAVGFVLLARPEPSVVRAAAMGLVALAGLGSGDRGRGLRALSLAVVVLVLLDPWLSRSPGFVLSVLATGGIVVLSPAWTAALRRWLPGWLAQALAVPLAAQLVCTPVVAAISGQASVVAVLANLLAAPAVGPATVLGLLAGLVGLAWEPAGRLVGWLAVLPAGWIVGVGGTAAGLPGADVGWGTTLPALGVLTLLCVGVGAVMGPLLRRRYASLGTAAALVFVLLRPVPSPGWPPDGWVFVACDVGQGDALVLPAGDRAAVVVDVGPDPALLRGCLDDLGVREVSAVVLTHLHADHVDGLRGVLGAFPVGQVEVSPVRSPPDAWDGVVAAADDAGVPVQLVAAGSTMRAGELSWRVLAPPATTDPLLDDDVGEGSPLNDASLVLSAEVHGVRLLLTGDVEPPTQAALVASGADLGADVLKVPHHGSARQDPAFLAAAEPSIAVVSVGADNDYGHPAPTLLAALTTGGAEVARTDLDGDVAVVSDGPGGDDLAWVTR